MYFVTVILYIIQLKLLVFLKCPSSLILHQTSQRKCLVRLPGS